MSAVTALHVASGRPVSAPSAIALDPARCRVADTPLARLRGLLGRPALRDGEGLLLVPCASVHTWFLRDAIDVVFLGRDGEVLRVVPRLGPWRAAGCRGARAVLELPPGTCARAGVGAGALLEVAY